MQEEFLCSLRHPRKFFSFNFFKKCFFIFGCSLSLCFFFPFQNSAQLQYFKLYQQKNPFIFLWKERILITVNGSKNKLPTCNSHFEATLKRILGWMNINNNSSKSSPMLSSMKMISEEFARKKDLHETFHLLEEKKIHYRKLSRIN